VGSVGAKEAGMGAAHKRAAHVRAADRKTGHTNAVNMIATMTGTKVVGKEAASTR
jgi:hypothetical protein